MAILELLVQKGRVKKCFKAQTCTTRCLKCQPETFASYQWIETKHLEKGMVNR